MKKMVKYKVAIPPPSAKRMAKNKKIVIEAGTGWCGCSPVVVNLAEDIAEYEFELPEEFEYIYNTSTIDGATFEVLVEYSNDSGTRKQRISLVPQKAN